VILCQIPAPEALAGLGRIVVCGDGIPGREAEGLILSPRLGCPAMVYW
jgi:hypothetical protein